MAARVLCFGVDDCNRSLVLRQVGYEVDRCPNLIEFRALIRERADAEAVVFTQGPGSDRRQVVTLTREHLHARLVLFNNSYARADEADFDLIIPPLTPPGEWLRQIAALIERGRGLKATATAIREESVLLRKDSEIARLHSMIEREKSATVRARAEKIISSFPLNPDSFEK
jgi:hypothetical protein